MGVSHDHMSWVFPLSFGCTMDVVELETWSFLKQQILQKIWFVSAQMGLQPLSRQVIDTVVQFYCAGLPTWNYSLHTMVVHLALGIHLAQFQHQVSGFLVSCHPTTSIFASDITNIFTDGCQCFEIPVTETLMGASVFCW